MIIKPWHIILGILCCGYIFCVEHSPVSVARSVCPSVCADLSGEFCMSVCAFHSLNVDAVDANLHKIVSTTHVNMCRYLWNMCAGSEATLAEPLRSRNIFRSSNPSFVKWIIPVKIVDTNIFQPNRIFMCVEIKLIFLCLIAHLSDD